MTTRAGYQRGGHPGAYSECSLGFEKKSFSADSDLMIESGIYDSMAGSFDIL